jgi:4-hydroxy-3-methylbut-2-enyl diphosphate reductase
MTARGSDPDGRIGAGGRSRRIVVCAPMRAEARALRKGAGGLAVVRTGAGPARAARAGASPAIAGLVGEIGGVVVAGIGGGLAPGLRTGDVVVATEVRVADGTMPPLVLPGAQGLAEALRRHGLTVHTGPAVSARRIVHGARRDRLAATGASTVDTETYWLLRHRLTRTGAAGRAGTADRTRLTDQGPPAVQLGRPVPVAWCVRVVADAAPGRVLAPRTLTAIRTALGRLPAVGAALAGWALTDHESTDHESTVREVRADGGATAAGR